MYKSFCVPFRKIADEQGLEPGSKAWNDGGDPAFGASSGGHASYGWRHDALLGLDWAKAVLANHGHRPIFYEGAPVRDAGYNNAGRPLGYVPSEPGDQEDGSILYGSVKVTGADVLHFHLSPLIAVADSSGFMVPCKGKFMDARFVARVMLPYFGAQLAGMLRTAPDKINPYVFGDRGSACEAHAGLLLAERGLIEMDDAMTLLVHFEQHVLPYYEKGPGLTLNKKANALPVPNFQPYNGLYWLLPTIYWVEQKCPEGSTKSRLQAVVERWSQWCVDLHEFAPSLGFNVAAFKSAAAEVASLPLATIKGTISAASPGVDCDLWGFAAARVARAVLGKPADDLVAVLDKKWLPKAKEPKVRPWLVGADREYA